MKLDIINLEQLIAHARGNRAVILKYLFQFEALIPERLAWLKKEVKAQNYEEVRHILHKMSPQLQFFGITNHLEIIRRLDDFNLNENEFAKLNLDPLFTILQQALDDVFRVKKQYTNKESYEQDKN